MGDRYLRKERSLGMALRVCSVGLPNILGVRYIGVLEMISVRMVRRKTTGIGEYVIGMTSAWKGRHR